MKRIQYNAPVILSFVLLSALALLLAYLTGGYSNQKLFSVYRASWADPFGYLRLFLHVLGHSGFTHFSGNMLMILVLGPMVEERYGSRNTLLLLAVTALTTGLIHCFFFPGSALLGASGIVFMLIFLASLSGSNGKGIPLTLIFVAVIYFSKEIYAGLFTADNISHLTHMIGGGCGIILGFLLRKK